MGAVPNDQGLTVVLMVTPPSIGPSANLRGTSHRYQAGGDGRQGKGETEGEAASAIGRGWPEAG